MKGDSFLLIFISILSLYLTQELEDNTTYNESETYNKSSDDFEVDIFSKFDYGNIIWLDDKNYTSELKKYNLIYVLFYSSWCPHCVDFAPTYINISKYSDEHNTGLKFAKINAQDNYNASEAFKVKAYPSLYLVYKGDKFLFEGERTKEEMMKFMNRKLNDDIFKAENLFQVNEYLKLNNMVVLSTIKNSDDDLYKSFVNASKTLMNDDFISCTSEECTKKYGEDILILKNFDEKMNKISEFIKKSHQVEHDVVKKFIGIYGIEAGGLLKNIHIPKIFEHRRKVIFFFRNSSDAEQTKYDNNIKQLGIYLRDKNIYSLVLDIEGDEYVNNLAHTFMVIEQDLPCVLFFDLQDNDTDGDTSPTFSIRPASDVQLKIEFLIDYVNKIMNHTIKRDLFSEYPQDEYEIDGLKYVIGRTYDKSVVEEKNNVLIAFIDEFYYCQNCETIINIMKSLKKIYNTDIVYAYTNVGRNEIRDLVIEELELPLLYLYTNKMKDKKIVQFQINNMTEVTENDVEKFLIDNLQLKKESIKEEILKNEDNIPKSDNKKNDKEKVDSKRNDKHIEDL